VKDVVKKLTEVAADPSGLFMKDSDEFAHGLNERAPVAAIDGALAHWNMLLKALAK
jgi:hypothetical protein